MKLILQDETTARLEMTGSGFDIVSDDVPLSPYHLLAGSLASCTVLTLQSWAQHAGTDMDALVVDVTWEKSHERPARIVRIGMEVRWPGLPADRVPAAERVADLCPIHATLARSADVSRSIIPLPAAPADDASPDRPSDRPYSASPSHSGHSTDR